MPTMSVHSWTLCKMTVRPWGIQASSTVTPRIDSQQTYRPHAAVYSSWILEFPVQKDISQRPVNTETQDKTYMTPLFLTVQWSLSLVEEKINDYLSLK